jgi:mono/diheme cytochrome c family protein
MKWWIAIPVFLAAASGLRSGASAQTPTPESVRDIGAEVRNVFAAKCAGCHGSDLPKPKGRFGYVLDLQKVAGNTEMVIPSRPDESELWVLVSRGEMPPPDSPHGPLSRAEKEIVRTWIAAGAPQASPPVPGSEDATAMPEAFPSITTHEGISIVDRTLRWLGKFHLLVLHLPIALMLAAGVAEMLSVWRGSRVPSQTVLFCLTLAAIAVVPTVALGWLHATAGNGIGSPQLLSAHRWVGTVAGVWVIVTALCAQRDARLGLRSRSSHVALIIGIALVVATAHFGGLMAHGSNFFDW